MPFSHREFNAFIHENEFCRLLYDFLEDNQDQVLHKDNDDLLTILYEAYRISGGITSMAASGCHINDYIKYVRAKYEGMTNVILSTVWTILSLQSNIAQSLRPAVCTLRNVVDGDKFSVSSTVSFLPSRDQRGTWRYFFLMICSSLIARRCQQKNQWRKPIRLWNL